MFVLIINFLKWKMSNCSAMEERKIGISIWVHSASRPWFEMERGSSMISSLYIALTQISSRHLTHRPWMKKYSTRKFGRLGWLKNSSLSTGKTRSRPRASEWTVTNRPTREKAATWRREKWLTWRNQENSIDITMVPINLLNTPDSSKRQSKKARYNTSTDTQAATPWLQASQPTLSPLFLTNSAATTTLTPIFSTQLCRLAACPKNKNYSRLDAKSWASWK